MEPAGGTAANGCAITALSESGAIAQDGRLVIGDLLLGINHESLRRVVAAQAETIVRRASMIHKQIG